MADGHLSSSIAGIVAQYAKDNPQWIVLCGARDSTMAHPVDLAVKKECIALCYKTVAKEWGMVGINVELVNGRKFTVTHALYSNEERHTLRQLGLMNDRDDPII